MTDKKIQSQKNLVKIVQGLKRQGKTIVTYSGSFDILHIGHIRSLNEAKRQGDVLIILLNSDDSVRSYKGPGRPINSQRDRADFLAALKCVDYVVIFDEINPKKILGKIKPDIHCNGSDWGRNCVERAEVEKYGGKIHILKWTKNFSTSNLIKKIITDNSRPPVRAVFLDRDGTINLNKQGYVHKIEDFEFLPGAVQALKKLLKTDYKIIVITNQSGIGRGYYGEKDVLKLHQWLVKTLARKGARIDKIYLCPHRPEEKCSCRKPGIGMFEKAVKEFGVSLSNSWMIGDDDKDIMAAKEANIKTIKIGGKLSPKLKLEPNDYAADLKEAIGIILA